MTPRSAALRRAAFAVVPVTILVVVGLVGSEVALRSRFDSIEKITGAAPWQTASWQGLTYHWDVYHPDFGWTNLPGFRSSPGAPWSISINSRGLRGSEEYSDETPSGRVRIAFFGDSLCFGEEVSDADTVPAWIERLDPRWQALNYGVHGYGLGQGVLRLEAEGGDLGARVVVLMVLFPENLVRATTDHFVHAKPVFRLVDGDLRIDNRPVPEASHMPWLLRTSYAAAWLFARRGSWNRTVFDPSGHVDLGRALIARAAAACQRRDQTLLVATLLAPAGLHEYVAEPRRRSALDASRSRLLGDLPAATLDLVPIQEAALFREGTVLFAPLAHWSSAGNRLWAEAILKEPVLQAGLSRWSGP